MAAKKDKGGPKKERKGSAQEKESDSEPESEEEEEMLTPAQQKKLQRQRAAFMNLGRQVLAIVCLVIMLTQQPFTVRPRMSGQNALKLVPVKLAICGAVNSASQSVTVMRNPTLATLINTTSQALLAPNEYLQARNSKRAMPAEKTVSGAFKKAGKALGRLVDDDKALKEMSYAPITAPNFPLIGAYSIVLGCLLGPIFPGAEYLTVTGCGVLMHASRGSGMEAQPELYVTGVVAVLGILLMDYSKPPKKEEPKKKKRR